MSLIRMTPITGPAAWRGLDFAGDESWVYRLSAADIDALDQALAAVAHSGQRFPDFSREHFPIGALGAALPAFAEALESGRGFLLPRGLPVARYTDEQLKSVCYGIGLHLGLPYHSDPSDVVGLMCVRKAREGGLSSLVSVASIYNQILLHHPQYLALYYRCWYFAHLCEPQPSLSPIFSFHEGKLSCRYLRQYLELGHELRGYPLSKVDIEALDLFDQVMHDPAIRLDMMLEPGDLQFANNYAVLHSRTAFQDHEAPELRRRMLRLWLKMPNARVLAPEFPGRNGFPAPLAAA